MIKIKKKNTQKDASQIKIAWYRQKNNINMREGKTKNEKKSNYFFFTFSFLYRKIYISLENIFGKSMLVYIVQL